ncbi:MAG TPA: cob(I)yrinic acid a,c-diamide adenosyltransferase [Thermodesulfovibrionales bacterium]|nr:cob(I)yrinic acid a,c-diamide adenosyltransferase [Thermodesulfovibrionales bacterium]
MNGRRLEPKEKVGLIVVLTGDGKGKTTAALGLALRATGQNMKVCLIEFMKGDMYSGEIDGLRRLSPNVELHITGKGFFRQTDNRSIYEEHRFLAQGAVNLAKEKMLSGAFDILILDEINNAVELRLVDVAQVVELLDSKPPLVHIVITGRNAHPEIIKRAHTVTEMKEIKHAYQQGIEPQPGIDY